MSFPPIREEVLPELGRCPEPPPGTRLVLMSEELMNALARTEGKRVTWDWGEPDANGWYTPTFTERAE